jgi:uncharacterized protein (DUF302 family)
MTGGLLVLGTAMLTAAYVLPDRGAAATAPGAQKGERKPLTFWSPGRPSKRNAHRPRRLSMRSTTVAVNQIRVETAKGFAEVAERLERQLGRFDAGVFRSLPADPEKAERRLGEMAGPSGLMRFSTMDHGALLAHTGKPVRAVQYVVGNPLFAVQMTRHNVAAGLYAPLRLLVYEDGRGKTVLEYDAPSSLFGQFRDDRITAVAEMLDRKMEALVAAATG